MQFQASWLFQLPHNSKLPCLYLQSWNSKGNKLKEIDANGNSTRFTYNSENRLVKKEYYEKDAKKENLTLAYTYGYDAGTPLLLTLTDEEGYAKRFYFDIMDRLVKTEETPDKSKYYTSSYTYDYSGNLTSETDAKGNTAKYVYNDLGRLTSKKDALSYETVYTYNSLDKVITAEEPGGRITKYTYDSMGRTAEERVYGKAAPAIYTYKKYIYDKNGNVTVLIQGKVEGSSDIVCSSTEYAYDSMNRLTDEYSKIDGEKKSHVKYAYDGNGNKTNITEYVDEAGTVTVKHLYTYDYANRVVNEEGVMSDASAADKTSKYGHYIKKFSYNLAGNLTSSEIYNGKDFDKTFYTYDYRNRLLGKQEPFTTAGALKTTSYTYTKRGNVASETVTCSGTEITTQYLYDGMGKVTAKIDPMGYVSKYLYDENGNLTKEIDPRYSALDAASAPGTLYEYDALNRPVKVVAFDGTAAIVTSYKEYDARGNVTKEADGEGYNKDKPTDSIGNINEYAAFNNVTRYISAQTAMDNRKNGTNNYSMKYTYDGAGRVLTEAD